MFRTIFLSLSLVLAALSTGCDQKDEADALLEIAKNPPKRKQIDTSLLGVNAFFVTPGMGTIGDQFRDIRFTLGLTHVRVLFAWTDAVQPTPGSSPNFGFYDNILAAVPPGMDVLVVLTHTPSWMSNSANWIDGDPRATWVEKWLKPVVTRYAGKGVISGFEVWNEPDLTTVASDSALGLTDPANYMELLALGSNAIREAAPGKLVVMAATQSIQQNYANNLNYNKQLKEMGAEEFIDVWNIHYYSSSYENVVIKNGVADFLNSVTKPIWLTESGATGVNNQLAYAETTWPFLTEKIKGINRIYQYQHTENSPPDITYGLRNPNGEFPVSDLYLHLRERAK